MRLYFQCARLRGRVHFYYDDALGADWARLLLVDASASGADASDLELGERACGEPGRSAPPLPSLPTTMR